VRLEQVEPRSLAQLCSLLGYSRQAFYQKKNQRERRLFEEELVIQEVIRIRQDQRRVGARKLLIMLQPFCKQHSIEMGRDIFMEVLRSQNLLVRKRRIKKPRTTWSYHWFRRYPNLIKGLFPTMANQLWVSDITYIAVADDFAYLSLITDAYSRKIVGFCLFADLSAKGCANALKMALQNNPYHPELVHHSDRGVQYCSAEYVEILQTENVRISMTQNGDPLENAIAERVNGILKDELLKTNYEDFNEALRAVEGAINIYNHQRLHSSINMLTPQQAHHLQGELKRLWKNYYKARQEERPVTV
jgi:transposase InsO family protein